jgi:DNA-binding NtrC family response regulator
MAKHDGQPIGRPDLEAELDSDVANTESAAIPRDDDQLLTLALRHLNETAHFSLDETLQRWESAYIAAAQQVTHGNVSQAAKLLGINRTTLYNRMEVLTRALGDTTESGT